MTVEHNTFVHGSEREGWWWGCGTCPTPPNQFTFRRDAQREADTHHRRTPNPEPTQATTEEN